ncbi:protein kinase [Nonomuraea sp. NBC_01738]|uniref:serine/threonine-protein kinase n=1 Tax=Nonomuraea sp. NBC_01738 TaxID=2976003 RepID=UPI002E11BCF6|nr:protein kinase [Nonomuraea sp. NBC_01738]
MVAQGTTLAGRYRLDTRIGAGGMGEVWRGEDIVLARTVAVKVLLPGRMDDPGFVARFQAEARAMATINHAGVVDVYDYGISNGDTVYLVMKFVDGEALDRLLARLGRIPPQPAMELIAQAASALQAVHDQGIVHRDVKPGNLLVQRDGTLVLTDFGIARSDLANRLTDAGMVLGTAAYCAPEQAEGAPVTPAVDIYALGVVAYESLVGQRPFDGDSAVTIALKHIREAPPPLPADIPAPVRALVEKALSKDPLRRFASAAEMSRAARAIATGQIPPELVTGATMAPPVEAYQTGSVQSTPPPAPVTAEDNTTQAAQQPRRGRRGAVKARRRGGFVAALAVALVLGAGAGAVAITGMGSDTPDPSTGVSSAAETGELTPTPTPTTPSKTKTKPPPTRATARPPTRAAEPTRDPEPTIKPTTSKPSSTPTPTKGTKSPSPTPVVKKRVPDVLNMGYSQARALITGAGLTIKVDDQEHEKYPLTCLTVVYVDPGAGTMLAVNKPVKLTLVKTNPNTPCATPTPGASPTPTPKP